MARPPHPALAHLAAPPAAIFSPSVARIAASTARDWNSVDSWLAAKFHGRTPPSFERNPETLRALLALASLNETADEERDLLARAEADALSEVDAAAANIGESSPPPFAEALLDSVEAGLTREGRVALDSMASVAVTLGVAYPEPDQLGQKMVDLQGRAFSLEQTSHRVEIMRRHLEDETVKIQDSLRELQRDQYAPPTDLAKRNLELQRRIRSMAAKLPELRDRVASLSSGASANHITADQLADDEARYLVALAKKRELESQLAAFQDLPSDIDSARSELDALRSELRALTQRRDAVFEGLVEAESPKKRRV